MKLTLQQVAFRAELWRKFVAGYHVVLAAHPESFSDYCAEIAKYLPLLNARADIVEGD